MSDSLRSMSIASFFGFVPVLECLSNLDAFLVFCSEHTIKLNEEDWQGFRFLLRIVLDRHFQQVRDGNLLGFRTNVRVNRATSQDGVSPRKLLADSQMGRFLRNLWQARQTILRARSRTGLQHELGHFVNDYVTPLRSIFETWVLISATKVKVARSRVLQLLAQNWIALGCHNISRMADVPLLESPMEKSAWHSQEVRDRRDFADRMLRGYELGLAFLWNQLGNRADARPLVESILRSQNWEELDSLDRRVLDMVVKTEVEELGLDILFGAVFRTSGAWNKALLSRWLVKETRQELTPDEKLDEFFLWYDFELLEGASLKIYAGVPAFVTALLGQIAVKHIYRNRKPVQVRRLRHPWHDDEKHTYSYAVLVESHGSLGSDFSGWLLFCDCCNDFSGFGGGLHRYAEEVIERYKDALELGELMLPLEDFKEYLERRVVDRLKEPGEYLSRTEMDLVEKRDMREISVDFRDSLGILLELVVARLLTEEKYETEWDYRHKPTLGSLEIDCLAWNTLRAYVVECSLRIPETEKETSDFLQEFGKKLTAVAKRFEGCQLCGLFVTTKAAVTHPELRRSIEKIRAAGIEVRFVEDWLRRVGHKADRFLKLLRRLPGLEALEWLQ